MQVLRKSTSAPDAYAHIFDSASQILSMKLLEQNGIATISPLSIMNAFVMTIMASSENTRRQMLDAIKVPEAAATNLLAHLIQLYDDFRRGSADTVKFTNLIMLDEGFETKDEYHVILGNFCDYVTESFQNSDAVTNVNQQIAKHTNGLIPTMFRDIDPATTMIILSIMYFNAKWRYPFRDCNARKFKGLRGKTQVEMMGHSSPIDCVCYEDGECQIVELPYKTGNRKFCMGIYLPRKVSDTFVPVDPMLFVDKLTNADVDVYIPKFTQESTLSLRESFQQMGVTDAFDENMAKFGGLSNRKDLYVSDIKHKVKIIVDTLGTEAAAVTSVEISKSCSLPPTPKMRFYADHTFQYYIRCDNVIILVGVFDG